MSRTVGNERQTVGGGGGSEGVRGEKGGVERDRTAGSVASAKPVLFTMERTDGLSSQRGREKDRGQGVGEWTCPRPDQGIQGFVFRGVS